MRKTASQKTTCALCVGLLLGVDACASKACEESPGGSGKVTGMVAGNGFPRIVAAYELGHVDAKNLMVLFAFDQSVTCCEMQDLGWDERVKNGTQMLEIGLAGTSAGTYPVSTAAEPPDGESSVVAKFKSADGLKESVASKGEVKIDSIRDGLVKGSFKLTFADGELSGTVSTAACADGVEP